MRVWSKSELKQLLMAETIEYPQGKAALKLKASTNSQSLWEFSCMSRHARGQISALPQEVELRNCVIRSLDRIAATELSLTSIWNKETRKTSQEDWEKWFLNNFTSPNLSSPVYLVPDTNFIMRRYASGLFRRMQEKNFKQLRFEIPNLAILEIEGIYNREKKKSENEKCEADERQSASIRKGEALIAAKELMFLREKGANMLFSSIVKETADSFAKISGQSAADMFIRKEIRDSLVGGGTYIFVTCDLMNALAATAEGIPACYFSIVDSGIWSVSDENETCMEQLADLIVDNALVFGEITIVESFPSSKTKTMLLSGNWESWALPDLLDEKIAELNSP